MQRVRPAGRSARVVSGVTVSRQNYRGGVRQAGAWGPNDQEQRPGEHPGAGEEERHAWAATADGWLRLGVCRAPFGALLYLGVPPFGYPAAARGGKRSPERKARAEVETGRVYSFLVTLTVFL